MSTFYKLALVAVLTLFMAGSGFAQFSVFVVDDDGNPATTYPTLQQGLTTAAGFPGTAAIKVMPGAYSDANLAIPANVVAIYGDSASAAGDIVFTAPLATDNFLALTNNVYMYNMTIVGYNRALEGTIVTGAAIDGIMFDGNARGVTLIGVAPGSDGNTVSNCTFQNGVNGGNDWALVIGANGDGNTITDNCFINNVTNGTAQAYDGNGGNSWTLNFFNDYNDLLLGPYYLDGGAGANDASPDRYDNSVNGPASVEVLDVVTYDIDWSIPACGEGDSVALAAYEFTVSYNPAVLSYVDADYDESYLGSVSAGALYTPINVDNVGGTLTFAATNFSVPGLGNGRLATVTFEAVGTGGTSLTIGSDYRDANNDSIPVQNTPLSVTVSDTEAPVIVTVAPNDPIGDDTYSAGSLAGIGPFVDLAVDVQATDNFDLDRIQYRFDGAGGWVNLVTGLSGMADGTAGEVATSVAALVGEGAHQLNLRARDNSGNFSAEVNYDFMIDRTGPVLATIVLSDADGCAVDADYTNDPAMTVDLTTADVDVTQMEFYEAGWQGPIAFAASSTYNLVNTTDGAKTVYARLYDAYGNMGNQLSDAITLDQVAPNPALFELAGGAAKTSTASITADANFDNPNGTWEYNVSEDAADLVCGGGGWLTTQPSAPHPFPFTLSAGDGVKTVYFAVRDRAGNISAVLSDDIELDATAPDLVSISLADPQGTVCSDEWTVDVTVEWADADVDELFIRNDMVTIPSPIDVSAETSPYTFSYTFVAPRTPNAVNTVYAWLEDDIDNAGAVSSADIFVDRTNPAFSAMTISDMTSADVVFSNDDEVAVDLTGDVDIIEIRFSEDNVTWGPWIAADFSGGTVATTYTFTSPVTENVAKTLYVEGQDCSGRSGAISDGGLYFDLTDPVLSAMMIDGGAAITNNTLVSVSLTITEFWQNGAATLTLSEDPGCDPLDPTTVTFVAPGAGPWAFTMTSGDGTKTIYAQFEDRAENVSAIISDDIMLDQTPPAGAMTVVSTNPLAVAGYTSTTSVSLESITYDGDVVDMQFRNGAGETGGSAQTAWMAAAGSYSPWTLGTIAGTTRNVQVRFRDAANNVGVWQTASIDYQPAAPAPPAWASGTPGGSTDLVWGAVADAQLYQVRYNFANEYPHYSSGTPPNPATMGAGIFEAQIPDTTYDFDGPGADMYAFTIWSLSNHGVWSASGNMDVVATNYILGDFYDSDADAMGPDGCIDFGDEFGELAIAYNSPPNAYYNALLDIAPTSDGSPSGYPIPDLAVDFEDLIIFALNYDVHRCAKKNGFEFDLGGTRLLAGPIDMSALVPTRVNAGAEVVVPVSVSQPEVIKGFHVRLDYNEADFELVRIEAGTAYETVEQSFFYFDRQSSDIDVSGVVFGADAAFTGDEMFRVVLRAKNSADVVMNDLELTFRDNQNQDIQAAFSTNPLLNGGLPTSFELVQNYPNPFNPSTTIEMALPAASDYRLTIFNVLGQVVDRYEGFAEAGYVVVNWDATNYSSGIYLYKMEAGTFEATRKMVLLK